MARPLALVTGASAGIGRALALRLAETGHDLALVARDMARLADVAKEAKAFGAEAILIDEDLSRSSAARAVWARLRDRPVDVLVNNAGFGLRGDFAGTDAAAESAMVRVHVDAVLELTKLALPGMLARKRGRVVTIGSLYSYAYAPRQAVYGATKAFALSFSQALSSELEGTGVTATAVLPGVTATEFHERAGIAAKRGVGAMSAEELAAAAYDGMERGARVVVPGLKNKLFVLAVRILPTAAVAALMRALNGWRFNATLPK